MLGELTTTLRVTIASIVLLCGGYTAVVLGGAALIAPNGRLGDLAEVDGRIVGSWRIAQAFAKPEYLWPRPSAAGFAAHAASGSNLTPTSPLIRERALGIIAALGATPERPAPAELVLASGAGLDPHLTLAGALYQAPRIAAARGASVEEVERIMRGAVEGSVAPVVNVLRANIQLDEVLGRASAGGP